MRQKAPTTDDICAAVQQQMGWHNGADFEEDRCGCDQCHTERDEARKIVSNIVELSHASLKARIQGLEGETARLSAQWIAETRRVEELEGALESIRQFGSDTLSGRADGPDDREWQRNGVREMTARARAALEAKPAGETR